MHNWKILDRHILATILLRTIFTGRFFKLRKLRAYLIYLFLSQYLSILATRQMGIFSDSHLFIFSKDFSRDVLNLCYWFLSQKESLARHNSSKKENHLFFFTPQPLPLKSLDMYSFVFNYLFVFCTKMNCCWRSNHQ